MIKIIIIASLSLFLFFIQPTVFANSTYGSGNYGDCQYSSCSITITSSAAVGLNLTPSDSGSCAIGSDSVVVTTHNTNGYFLQLNATTSQTSLNNGSSFIPSTTGTFTDPTVLTTNRWGFRVDGQGGFGTGPTTNLTNPSLSTFSGLTIAPGYTIRTTTTPTPKNNGVDIGDTTVVWYGVCADSSNKNGTYSASITYTATANP